MIERNTWPRVLCVMAAALTCLPGIASAGSKAPEAPLTEQGEKFQVHYAAMLSSLNKEVAAALPGVDEKKKAAFLDARAKLGGLLASGKLDFKLMKAAVLRHATPRGLAEFAQQGAEEKGLLDKLFADEALIKQMLVAGGVIGPETAAHAMSQDCYERLAR